MKHFISLKSLSEGSLKQLLELAQKIKAKPSAYRGVLKDKYIGLLFEKPSLRTKTAFYVGTLELGGEAIYYTPQEIKLGEREKVSDVSQTLSKLLDCVVLRTFSHKSILEFAKYAQIPIINGLSDLLHPTQVLADILTISECKDTLKKLKVAYIGDGNNVCHSLIYAFSILGGNLFIATPKGYLPNKKILKEAKSFSKDSGAKINLVTVGEAAKEADVLYTDVWASMGKEKEKVQRKKVFKNFQINDKILKLAKKNCMVLHCLPAHRGEEITSSVLDSKNSVIFRQAENRLHTAKAILLYLLKK